MKITQRRQQKGFTLIEVSLAIVIGVVILAGGITLYNQTKTNAGNSKAQEKVQAFAAMVEEVAAVANSGSYPAIGQLQTLWTSRRDDWASSPWGGQIANANTNAIIQMPADIGTPGTPISQFASASNTAPYDKAWTTANSSYIGSIVYFSGSGASDFYDLAAAGSKRVVGYVAGIVNNAGGGPCYVVGGH